MVNGFVCSWDGISILCLVDRMCGLVVVVVVVVVPFSLFGLLVSILRWVAIKLSMQKMAYCSYHNVNMSVCPMYTGGVLLQ